MAALHGDRLHFLDGKPLADRAVAGHLLGVGDAHRVGLFDLLGVRNPDRVAGRTLLGVGNLHRVARRLLFLDRHHHRVGLLDALGVGDLDRPAPALLFLDRDHHGVVLLNRLRVGNLDRVVTGAGFRNGRVDGVVHRLGARLGHVHRVLAGPLLGAGDALRDGVRPLTLLLDILRDVDVTALGDPLAAEHLAGGTTGGGTLAADRTFADDSAFANDGTLRSGRRGGLTLDDRGLGVSHATVGENGTGLDHGLLTVGKSAARTDGNSGNPVQEAERQTLLHRILRMERKKGNGSRTLGRSVAWPANPRWKACHSSAPTELAALFPCRSRRRYVARSP